MFVMVKEMKGKPWAKVKQVMEEHRLILSTIEDEWLEDSEMRRGDLRAIKLEREERGGKDNREDARVPDCSHVDCESLSDLDGGMGLERCPGITRRRIEWRRSALKIRIVAVTKEKDRFTRQ
jgi:hypothetical protein